MLLRDVNQILIVISCIYQGNQVVSCPPLWTRLQTTCVRDSGKLIKSGYLRRYCKAMSKTNINILEITDPSVNTFVCNHVKKMRFRGGIFLLWLIKLPQTRSNSWTSLNTLKYTKPRDYNNFNKLVLTQKAPTQQKSVIIDPSDCTWKYANPNIRGYTFCQTDPDVDECKTKSHGCIHICKNTIGSYSCVCRPGYDITIRGGTCMDIDECKRGMCNTTCKNTIGSYVCQKCKPGYRPSKLNGTCEEIDECKVLNGGCPDLCHNTVGSYSCGCSKGYVYLNASNTCKDVDECKQKNGGCSLKCYNKIGSYSCQCSIGFSWNSKFASCEDIDECAQVNSISCQQLCVNTVGSRTCDCLRGYQTSLSNPMECVACNSTCSSEKECSPGYELDTTSNNCTDIDECETDNGKCESSCENTDGDYICTCEEGLELVGPYKCDSSRASIWTWVYLLGAIQVGAMFLLCCLRDRIQQTEDELAPSDDINESQDSRVIGALQYDLKRGLKSPGQYTHGFGADMSVYSESLISGYSNETEM